MTTIPSTPRPRRPPRAALALAATLLAVPLTLPSPSSALAAAAAAGKATAPKKGGAKAKEPKMTKTKSGLQFADLTPGAGASPAPGKLVRVHYTGWLNDGTKFDSSLDRGRPFDFTIGRGQVIQGWDEGVMTMKVGGKRKLVIPPALGYGERGAGGVIPPNAELTFEVELLDVK